MIRRIAVIAVIAAATAAIGRSSPAGADPPRADPAAMKTVARYMRALAAREWQQAFDLLVPAQQRYFGSAANFASNPLSTHYAIRKYSLGTPLVHRDVIEVPVKQWVYVLDVGTGTEIAATVNEPVFALREQSGWGVKQLYQPWKAYAPNATGTNNGVEVTVNRVEFFDRRVTLDCTIRNAGKTPVQILPLLKSTLNDGAGHVYAAMSEATFPLNDLEFFKGPRIYPSHQAVGFINFGVPEKRDETSAFTLTVGPAIEDGGAQTFSVSVGPFALPKL
jgi:hypothetical protein